MMLAKIENYYKNLGLNPFLVQKKLSKLEKHPDIAEEFAFWIDHHKFKSSCCVTVSEYTASRLAQLSEVLNGEAAFMLLVELRDEPNKAMQRISDSFCIL